MGSRRVSVRMGNLNQPKNQSSIQGLAGLLVNLGRGRSNYSNCRA
jgi:hypothetical protein